MQSQKNENKNVIIVGAGLVGSLLAILLAKRGWNVNVFEKRPDLRKQQVDGNRSINLVIAHRGWKALQLAGIDKEIRPITVPVYGRMIHDTEGNTKFLPYSIDHQAIYSVSRSGLNAKLMDLAEQLPNVRFHFQHRCESVDFEENTVTFYDNENNTYITQNGSLIIGADGANSAVRNSMMTGKRFNYSQEFIEHGYKEIVFPKGKDGTYVFDPSALHIWPRKNFMLMCLANPDGTFTGTLFMHYEGPDSFETITDKNSLFSFFEKNFKDTLPLIPDLENEYFNHPTSHLMIVKCYPWVFGKTALIGDAAHAIVPFYGEGMNCGFEDAYVLCRLIDENPHKDIQDILKEYQKTRKPSADAIAELSMRNFIEMRDKVADPVFELQKKIEAKLQSRYPEIWIPLYAQVKFTDIPYEKALATGIMQDKIMEEIMKIPNIQQKWDDDEVLQMAIKKLYEYNQ